MSTVLVTGSNGFIGRNLILELLRLPGLTVKGFDINDTNEVLESHLREVDFVFHLAGVNRPQDPSEFELGNTGLTQTIVGFLRQEGKKTPILISSSVQAEHDNPYGISKRQAEQIVFTYGRDSGVPAYIYRLPNVFGKWCRPNYNSVVATFCHNIANGLSIQINDPKRELTLVYIDDVVQEFLAAMNGSPSQLSDGHCTVHRTFNITLQSLADTISIFPTIRKTGHLPNMADDLTRFLYSTYLSYLPEDRFAYPLEMKCDNRGWLAEFLKSPHIGQIFVSVTKPDITRGNHWHHTKVEKFLVLNGDAIIRLRHVLRDEVLEYRVSGGKPEPVDIPPGYTHNITNVGDTDLVALFWACEPFDVSKPDTNAQNV